MVWEATVTAPSAAAEVTVIVRVTYRSLEQLCRDERDALARILDEAALN